MTNLLKDNIHCLTKNGDKYFKFDKCFHYVDFYKDYCIDSDGRREAYSLKSILDQFEVLDPKENVVLQINYELGFLFESLEELIDPNQRLFSIFYFSELEEFKMNESEEFSKNNFKYDLNREAYYSKFDQVQQNLLAGNCYQVNLTNLVTVDVDSHEHLKNQFLSLVDKHGHFFHYLLTDKYELLSNSPECLFEIENDRLITRPIKGTIESSKSLETLKSSEKDISELNIITDLLRNDLSRISENFSKVTKLRDYFEVPGLYQQYSQIEVKLPSKVTLYDILKAIYPGGSITGAPKRRVLEIIKNIEDSKRDFYTGSTVFLSSKFTRASINIRTAQIQDNTLKYGTGGGLTLLSDRELEYNEMTGKINSFFKSFC